PASLLPALRQPRRALVRGLRGRVRRAHQRPATGSRRRRARRGRAAGDVPGVRPLRPVPASALPALDDRARPAPRRLAPRPPRPPAGPPTRPPRPRPWGSRPGARPPPRPSRRPSASPPQQQPSGQSPDQAVVLLWATLHGLVTLRVSRPSFPWPPIEQLVDQAVATSLNSLADPPAPELGHRRARTE